MEETKKNIITKYSNKLKKNFIDLIIPFYNASETLPALLGSILSQSCKDQITVYIVNDKSDEKETEKLQLIVKDFERYLKINLLQHKENQGPGVARQTGIDCGDSKYLLFADADDVFYDFLSIESLLDYAETSGSNVVVSKFAEETENDYVQHTNDTTWMFGKLYKREYLENNGIKFNATRQNEDAGFNGKALVLEAPDPIARVTYVWKYNPNSITRVNDGEYTFTNIGGMVDNKIDSVNFLIEKNFGDKNVDTILINQMIYFYLAYNHYIEEGKEDIAKPHLKRFREAFADRLDKYLSLPLDELTDENKALVEFCYINTSNSYFLRDNMYPVRLTLQDFYNNVCK